MGSTDFASKVFNKVFREDIERLRAMEDMWKTRKPPQPLSFDELQEQSTSVEATISCVDQKVWTLAEDFVVFKDRLGTHPLLDFSRGLQINLTRGATVWIA